MSSGRNHYSKQTVQVKDVFMKGSIQARKLILYTGKLH
jgi:hypothetical protein